MITKKRIWKETLHYINTLPILSPEDAERLKGALSDYGITEGITVDNSNDYLEFVYSQLPPDVVEFSRENCTLLFEKECFGSCTQIDKPSYVLLLEPSGYAGQPEVTVPVLASLIGQCWLGLTDDCVDQAEQLESKKAVDELMVEWNIPVFLVYAP